MIGMKGTTVLSPSGETKSVSFTPPPGASPDMSKQFDKSMEYAGVPLPTEPVSKGAKWQVTQLVEEQGMKLTQITTYELQELNGNLATLAMTIEQKADAQQLSPAGLPPGATAELVSFNSSGSGTSQLNLSQLLPSQANIGLDMATQMKMSADGQNMEMSMKMDMQMDMKTR